MRQISSRPLVGLTLMMSVIGFAQSARAQDLFVPARQPAPARGQLPRADEWVAAVDQFDTLILGEDAKSARARLEARLVRLIDHVDQRYELAPEQKKKLELAGRGDIKRFFDRVSEMKRQLEDPDADRVAGRPTARDLQSLRQEFQRNHFDDGSLFSKTLKKMLTPDRRVRYEQRDRVAAYRTRVNWVLFPLDQELGLSREQHRRVLDVIAKETRPLEKYDEHDEDVILLQASRLPEAKLKAILDEFQWHRLRRRFDRARRMESLLVEKGYIARGKN